MSYIVKNCPCRMSLHENDCFGHTGYYNCCACTDCVIKQIVELCKEESSIMQHKQKIKVKGLNKLADKIFELLDIEEIKE